MPRSFLSEDVLLLLRDMWKLASSAALVQGVALLALPFLQSWCYGPDSFADFALYSQLAGLFGAVATGRMELAIIRHKDTTLARGAWQNGWRLLMASVALGALTGWMLQRGGSDMGKVAGLPWMLPLGILGLGMGTLASGWMTRHQAFSPLAKTRATGGILGEGWRFASAGLGSTGLILGRILGQWTASILAMRWVFKTSGVTTPSGPSNRRGAWLMDRDFLRFTTPANVLAMAANALLVLFLFERAPREFVGQVGAGMAYLTVAAGLVIRSVNEVHYASLTQVPKRRLPIQYVRWSLGLMALSALGVLALHLVPEPWVVRGLGERWSAMLPSMRPLSLYLIPWIAASSLSGIFPHLNQQRRAFQLDALHLLLIAVWLGVVWWPTSPETLVDRSFDFLLQYAGIQSAFYVLALIVGWRLCASSGAD